MKEILQNIALLDAIKYCKENGIDCSDTHIAKYPRKFTYALIKEKTASVILSITYYKNRVPFITSHN